MLRLDGRFSVNMSRSNLKTVTVWETWECEARHYKDITQSINEQNLIVCILSVSVYVMNCAKTHPHCEIKAEDVCDAIKGCQRRDFTWSHHPLPLNSSLWISLKPKNQHHNCIKQRFPVFNVKCINLRSPSNICLWAQQHCTTHECDSSLGEYCMQSREVREYTQIEKESS